MATVTKGKLMRSDVDNYDGTLATSRADSSGGTESGLKVGDGIDVLSVFGGGDASNMTDATITTATSSLGSSKNVALIFAPGTWTISNTISIGSNFTVVVPAGCVFDVAASKTMTVAGVFFRQHATYSSGSGTFTISGSDVLSPTINTIQQLSSVAGTNTITATAASTLGSYTANDIFIFTPASDNTGATTLNIDVVGAGAVQLNGVALVGGELQASVPVVVQCTATTPVFEILGNSGVLRPIGDTTTGMAAGLGYTATEGLVITGQGSTNDVTIKNDADTEVIGILTGTTTAKFAGQITAGGNIVSDTDSTDDLGTTSVRFVNLYVDAIGDSGQALTNNALYHSIPNQPAFLANNSVEDANATGNGTTATVDFDTEIFDQGSNFASDTFTAPVTGRYFLSTQVRLDEITSAADIIQLIIVTSNRTYEHRLDRANGFGLRETIALSVVADMDASDTATVTVEVTGEASDVVDIEILNTFFAGCLLA